MVSYGDVLLQVKNINLDYQGNNILHDINFTIKDVLRKDLIQGQVVSLIGRSGIGKTQLFKLIAGFNSPTSGEILLNNKTITEGNIGVVPQNYVLFNHRKIKDNLRLATKNHPTNEMILRYIELFELSDVVDKYPYQLSGGQRQRVSIIQQLLANHTTILLDEPFSGLDSIMISKLLDVIIKLMEAREDLTMFIISHDLENSLIISDRALVLGKINPNRGATIVKDYNLIDEGFAWKYNYEDINFKRILKEIKTIL